MESVVFELTEHIRKLREINFDYYYDRECLISLDTTLFFRRYSKILDMINVVDRDVICDLLEEHIFSEICMEEDF